MRHALLLVPVLSCLFLSACTDGDDSPAVLPTRTNSGGLPAVTGSTAGDLGPAARLARAPAATAASGTAHTATVASVTGLPGRDVPFVLSGEGAVDFVRGASRSMLRVDGAVGDPPPTNLIETVTTGGLIYVRAPALTSLAGTSTGWVRIDPAAGSDGTGSDLGASRFGPLTALAGHDLGAPIAMLAGVDPSSVREMGTEEDITSLRATVDLMAAVPAGADPGDLAAVETFLDGLGARRLRVEVELDGGDRLRRLVYEHDVPAPAGPVRQRFDVAYFDFGAPVEISAPPDEQVGDLAGVLQGPR